ARENGKRVVLETVGRSLTDAVRKLLRMPNVDEKAVKELVKDLQRTLLQADVNVELVLQLSKAVEDRSLKANLPPGITRREHVVKVLYEEMTKFVGQDPAKVEVQPSVFRKLMLVGIQATGKTTSSVKLGRFFQKRGISQDGACHEARPVGSVLLSKMDGAGKGGGGLSAVAGTGSKVKFIGTGERVEGLGQFVPTDFVGRRVGMGDLNALLEKVKEA